MINNIEISNSIVDNKQNKHKRYLLVATSDYGEDYITKTPIITPLKSIAEKGSRMVLPEIDVITSSELDSESLLIKYNIFNYKSPAKVTIQYQSYGETKLLPVMYNDDLLKRISLQSTNKVVKNKDTDEIFSNIKEKLSINEDSLINRLLNSKFKITDPKIRVILNNYLKNKVDKINFNQLYSLIHDHYKQWRTFYYHTSDHYKKSSPQMQKKL